MKWYEKIIGVFGVIILSPLILFIFIIWLIIMPFIAIFNRISYKKSSYYKEFKLPFRKKVFESKEYEFYNYAVEKGLKIKYIKQKTKSLDYFIYEDKIFIFPDFSELHYNEEKQNWEVVYKHYKEESSYSLDEFFNKKLSLFEKQIDLPLRLLVSRDYFKEGYLDLSKLPETLKVIKNYNSAFQNENEYYLSMIPQTTKDLYEMMLKNDKLMGKFELVSDELIVWTFDKVIYELSIDLHDGCFIVKKNNKLKLEITHWHPSNYEIYDEVCKIGEKGNILVIKTILGSSQVLYMGPIDKCHINKRKFHLGKMYFFEAK